MSRIIVFEGPDRVGKKTQSAKLKEYLEVNSKKALVVEVPIDDGITYKLIYWMLGTGLVKYFPGLFQGLQFLNRFLFQTFRLNKLEHQYDYIIFDRWSLSTVVYGAATGVNPAFSNMLYNMIRKPDFTVVLLGGAHKHEAEDAYEKDLDLQEKVSSLYADWVNDHPVESAVVDCKIPVDMLSLCIISVLKASRAIPI